MQLGVHLTTIDVCRAAVVGLAVDLLLLVVDWVVDPVLR
jgi:hypothetical protein